MKRQLSAVGNYTEKELEEYMKSNKMIDSLWKLSVSDIESTLSLVCKLVLQDSTAKREELCARAKGLKTLRRSSRLQSRRPLASVHLSPLCRNQLLLSRIKEKLVEGNNGQFG
ncbi:hypothetical protein Bca101_055058 [Brassica carinata]